MNPRISLPVSGAVRLQVVVCVGLLSLACAQAGVDSAWVAEESRTGDTLTVRTLSGQLWSESRTPSVDLAIGVLDGDATYMFGEITRLAEDGDGGIYVFDGQVPVLRHYDSGGEYVGDVGTAGSGPGEYQSLSLGMVVDLDGVLYFSDWGNGRINRYLPSGEPLDSWRVDAPFLTTTPGRWIFWDAAGRLLLRANPLGRPGLLAISNGEVVDTLWVPDLPGLPERRGGPYRVDRYFGWHPGGHLVVGVSDSYQLEHRRPNGVLRFGRVVDASPVYPTEAAQWRRRFEWMEAQPSYRAPTGEWIPDYMPPFRALQVADDGDVWVRRNVAPISVESTGSEGGMPPVTWVQPHAYDVFDSDGRYRGEVEFAEDIEPLLFGDGAIWGVRRGDFDEQYVVRMSVVTGTEPE